jgi:purine-cytosine permease-like protein
MPRRGFLENDWAMQNSSIAVASRTRIETRSIDFVPESERHGRVSDQGPFWFLSNFHFFSIAIGFVGPSLGLSLSSTIVAGALGIMIGTTFQAFHAAQGPELGLPQMIQSRAQFGFRGVIVPLFAALLSPLGFNIVATLLIVDGARGLWGVDRPTAAIAVAVASGALAIFGYDWMHRVFRLLFWISLPLFAVLSLAILLGHAGGAGHAASGFGWPAFFTQVAAAASYNIGAAPYVSDYSRYLPKRTSRWKIIGYVFAGSALSAIWLIALGSWLATHFGATDGLTSLRQAGDAVMGGLGSLSVTVSICALIATVGMNSYSAMLIFLTSVDCLHPVQPTRRLRIAVILGVTAVWLTIAVSLRGSAVGYVNSVLVLLLYFLIPWTAVNLVDYFILRRGHYVIADLFTPHGVYGAWGTRGLIAYAMGFLASVPFFVVPDLYTGPLAARIGNVDIGWIVGLATASGVYLLSSFRFTVRDNAKIATG